MQRYGAAGYSRARMLAQLVADGIPPAELEPHFPGFPPSAFQKAVMPGPRAVTPRLPTPATASVPPVAARPVAVAAASAANRTGVVTAEEGISFHYVPLIQCSFPHADPGELTSFTRKNGWLELTLGTTRPETGIAVRRPGTAPDDLLRQ